MTDKSDDKVGHLNTILARGGGNLNDPIFKSSNARGLPGGGMLKFRVDRRINLLETCSRDILYRQVPQFSDTISSRSEGRRPERSEVNKFVGPRS